MMQMNVNVVVTDDGHLESIGATGISKQNGLPLHIKVRAAPNLKAGKIILSLKSKCDELMKR